MAACAVPRKVLEKIDRVFSDFLLGSDPTLRRRKWVRWESITCPYGEGGLGIRSLARVIKALRIKSIWGVVIANTLWGKFLHAKYFKTGVTLLDTKLKSPCSKLWRDVHAEMATFVRNSAMKFGPGGFSFLKENWTRNGLLMDEFPMVNQADMSLEVAASLGFDRVNCFGD